MARPIPRVAPVDEGHLAVESELHQGSGGGVGGGSGVGAEARAVREAPHAGSAAAPA